MHQLLRCQERGRGTRPWVSRRTTCKAARTSAADRPGGALPAASRPVHAPQSHRACQRRHCVQTWPAPWPWWGEPSTSRREPHAPTQLCLRPRGPAAPAALGPQPNVLVRPPPRLELMFICRFGAPLARNLHPILQRRAPRHSGALPTDAQSPPRPPPPYNS